MSGPYARLDQGQVRGLERGGPLAAEVFDKSR